jgi:purine-cytosine permease-like protein
VGLGSVKFFDSAHIISLVVSTLKTNTTNNYMAGVTNLKNSKDDKNKKSENKH